MKFLSVRDLRGKSGDVWRTLPVVREMVVTSNGRPVAILSSVDESNLEENLDAIRQVRATAAVTKLQSAAASRGMDKLSADDVRAEIRAVRRARSK